jgi:demethylmenaquinone methyltransferase/2-methoxy-6-polyprenyl-1,4-benzoquinol methylase
MQPWPAVKEYYDTRAPEYDEWYLGTGLFAQRDRPHWDQAVSALERAVAALPLANTLDVACGTGFLTRHLRGEVTALDQSARMLAIARERLPGARLVHGDALELQFEEDAFDRVFTGHFYGHLEGAERERFLTEARRVAPELVIVDAAVRPDHDLEEWQERVLGDGSRFGVYKRYFDPLDLAAELGGGTVLHASAWFVMVRSSRAPFLGGSE